MDWGLPRPTLIWMLQLCVSLCCSSLASVISTTWSPCRPSCSPGSLSFGSKPSIWLPKEESIWSSVVSFSGLICPLDLFVCSRQALCIVGVQGLLLVRIHISSDCTFTLNQIFSTRWKHMSTRNGRPLFGSNQMFLLHPLCLQILPVQRGQRKLVKEEKGDSWGLVGAKRFLSHISIMKIALCAYKELSWHQLSYLETILAVN